MCKFIYGQEFKNELIKHSLSYQIGRGAHTVSEPFYTVTSTIEDGKKNEKEIKNIQDELNRNIRKAIKQADLYSGEATIDKVKNVNSIIIMAECAAFIDYIERTSSIYMNETIEFTLMFLIAERILKLENMSVEEVLSYIYSVINIDEKGLKEGRELILNSLQPFFEMLECYLLEDHDLNLLPILYPKINMAKGNVFTSEEYNLLINEGLLMGSEYKDSNSFITIESAKLYYLLEAISRSFITIISKRCEIGINRIEEMLIHEGDRIITEDGYSILGSDYSKGEKNLLWSNCLNVKKIYPAVLDEYALVTLMHVFTYKHKYKFVSIR